MTPEQKKAAKHKLKLLQALNGKMTNSMGGNLTSFQPGTENVVMPVKEYKVLIDAQDRLKELVRGVADGEERIESERLRAFRITVVFAQDLSRTNAPTSISIEMVVLDTCEDDAVKEVKKILESDGYDDIDKTLIHVNEIKGPFDKGFVIQRNGG